MNTCDEDIEADDKIIAEDTNSRSYPKTYRSMSYTKTKPSWLSTNRQDWSYTPDTGIIAGHW